MIGAVPCRRGCGTRTAGGVYAEVGVGPGGFPLEHFLLCPPTKLGEEAQQALGITPVGVKLIEREGVWHMLDWVGSQHYLNLADFVEEARRFGVSRRLLSNMEFEKLTPASRLILIHARAWIQDAWGYYFAMPFIHASGSPYVADGARTCPKGWPQHNRPSDPPAQCSQLWWQDIDGGVANPHPEWSARRVIRTMPSFAYSAFAAPPKVHRAWVPAIFASFPISRIVVIRDPIGGTHRKHLAHASTAQGIPTSLEEE